MPLQPCLAPPISVLMALAVGAGELEPAAAIIVSDEAAGAGVTGSDWVPPHPVAPRRIRPKAARRRVNGRARKGAALGFKAIALAKCPTRAFAFGAALFVSGVVLLWYGRDLKRAVLPGVAAGFVPLVLALCAVHVDHACTGDGCMMLCVPECTVGGIVAGLTVSGVGLARDSGVTLALRNWRRGAYRFDGLLVRRSF